MSVTSPTPCAGRCALVLALAALLLCVIHSESHAISQRTLIAPTGAVAGDNFGISVASAGDVNGDGYTDVIVGAYMNDAGGAEAGRAYVYFGGPGADAVADLTLTGAAALDYFGWSVATAGDFNGDGFSDVIVGANSNNAGGADAGRAYVYFGGPGADAVADLTLTGAAAGDQFGISVSTAGDVNGDGHADVIVGALFNDTGGTDAGRAYVYFGGPGADAVADLTLTGAAAGDQFGRSVETAGDVNGDGYADVIVGAPLNDGGGTNTGRAYVYYGGPGADAVADLTLTGAAGGDNFGWPVGTAGDVNGDGYADVIVGAFYNDAGGTDAGRAYVYYGGPAADAVADLTLTGAAASDVFGYSVGTAGDVNGDGYADVIVGARLNDAGGTDAGRAYVYYGGSAADAVADLTLSGAAAGDYFGFSVGTAGDVNGDGFSDVIVGAYDNDAGGAAAGRAYVYAIYPYQVLSPNGGEQWVAGQPVTVRWLGHDVADLQLSTDGGATTWFTIASGLGGAAENSHTLTAPSRTSEFAKVRLVYSGQQAKRSTSDATDGVFRIVAPHDPPAAAHRLAQTFTGESENNWFGHVAAAGDFDGDGYDDVIVGANGNDAGGTDAGRAYVYFGAPVPAQAPGLILTSTLAGEQFGAAVAGAGDFNGDGFSDLIVGAPYSDLGGTQAGRAYLFFGGPGDPSADLVLEGTAAGDELGYSVGTAGDVNGDGFDDVIVGVPQWSIGTGRAYVCFGGPSPNLYPDLTLLGETTGDAFGVSVATAGDLDGDGFDDIVVGAGDNDFGGTDAGRAYVYRGGTVPDATADLVLTGTVSRSYLGRCVRAAGDFDGDGHGDLIIGSPHLYGGFGRALVFLGGPGMDAVADLTLVGERAGDWFGWSVDAAGDVNADGYADVLVGALYNGSGGDQAGEAYVYLGGPGADAIADWTLVGGAAYDHFGEFLAAAGDIDADGFDDIVVGAPGHDTGQSDTGRAYLYAGARYVVTAPSGGETWNVGAIRTVRWLGAEPADLWLSVDGGASYLPLASAVGGDDENVYHLRVPHSPTRFARVKLTPHESGVTGAGVSDSLFTIQTSVALLAFSAAPAADGGALLTWSTEPGVGADGLAGWRLYRCAAGVAGDGVRIGPELITEPRYVDATATPGCSWRLAAVNGLAEELELGRVTMTEAFAGMRAWPSPLTRGVPLTVAFAAVTGAAGAPVSDLDVGVFDVNGRRVTTLAQGQLALPPGGVHRLSWDGGVAAGIYFVRVAAPSVGVRHERKVVVMR